MNNTIPPIETWRHEKKSLLTDISYHELINLIKRHPYHFTEPYPERYVNNIYFDDCQLSHYNANISGISYRTKLRLRWYGDASGVIDPVLELKIKKGHLGTKLRADILRFELPENLSGEKVMKLLNSNELPQQIHEILGRTKPQVMNRYLRRYFVSADGAFRITVDSDVSFRRIFHLCGSQTGNNLNNHLVLEFKYDQEAEERAHLVTGYFPFRITKSSKYVAGIQKTYPMLANIVD